MPCTRVAPAETAIDSWGGGYRCLVNEAKTNNEAVYRAPIRARSVEAGTFEGARRCVERALVGTGEPLMTNPADLEAAILAASEQHGAKAGRMLSRFAGIPEGALVWTRTGEDEYRLGRVAGPWRYDDSDEALATGICQVRPADWLEDPFEFLVVPAAVTQTFARGGRNFQRIRDEECDRLTRDLWRATDGSGS